MTGISELPELKIKKLRKTAKMPFRATKGAAAHDLFAALSSGVTIPPGEVLAVPTGIAVELPSEEYVALIFLRSGLGLKHGIGMINSVGVIDSDYRGEIIVSLINHSGKPFDINPGDRLAQMMITKTYLLPITEVSELSDTERGSGGFGSTGKS